MLWVLPLEPFEWRYTSDWFRWFSKEFDRLGVKYTYVLGESLTDRIEVGRFLDVYNTINWKMIQIANVAKLFREKKVKDGDVFFTMDLWHPGFESVLYMAQLSGIAVRTYGILHAGTYDPYDFTAQAGLGYWAKYHERGWMASVDGIFVGSQFHKNLIVANRYEFGLEDKIHVTGLPFYGGELQAKYGQTEKDKNLVVFPNRIDPEKQPDVFDQITEGVLHEYPGARFVKTQEVCKTKDEYYRTLASASIAVSCSLQETFGYAMLESWALGCKVVTPNRLSYPEMPYAIYVYDSVRSAVDLIVGLLSTNKYLEPYNPRFETSIERMILWMIDD